MNMLRGVFSLSLLLLVLGGCSTIDSLTGQTDNTVLPGQREDAIPGRAQFPDRPDPLVKSSNSAQPPAEVPDSGAAPDSGCSADDPGCQPASNDGVFSDPQ
jgi:hypothetical protein